MSFHSYVANYQSFLSTNPLPLSDRALQHLFHGHLFPLNAVPLQDFAYRCDRGRKIQKKDGGFWLEKIMELNGE